MSCSHTYSSLYDINMSKCFREQGIEGLAPTFAWISNLGCRYMTHLLSHKLPITIVEVEWA